MQFPLIIVAVAGCSLGVLACSSDGRSVSRESAGGVAQAVNAPQDEILTAGNFKISIAGCQTSSDAVTAEVDPIEIEMHDVTQSNDPTWKVFASGEAHFGAARFTFRTSDQAFNSCLSTWLEETKSGNGIRKNITITIFKKDRSTVGRTYNLVDSSPTAFTVGAASTTADSDIVKLEVAPARIELVDGDGVPDIAPPHDSVASGPHQGTTIAFKGVDGAPTSVDSAWTSISGGELSVELVEATVGNDGERRFTPGKQYVSDLTLTGAMKPTRTALTQWLNNSAAGSGDLRADLTITPVKAAGEPLSPHNYYDAMITRIQIPTLSAGSAEPIEEVVVIKATRYEVAGQPPGDLASVE